jgi:hypothetical protein
MIRPWTRPFFVCLVAAALVAGCTSEDSEKASPTTEGGSGASAKKGVATAVSGDTRPPLNPADNGRLFAADAPWNRTAAELGRSEKYQDYVENFLHMGNRGALDDPAWRGRFSTYFSEYSVPIYPLSDATQEIPVWTAGFGYPGNLTDGALAPWNPAWEPAGGNDQMLMVADPETGRWWSLWLVQKVNWTGCLTIENLAKGYTPGSGICVGGGNLATAIDGSVADYRSSSGVLGGRGMGLEKLEMVVTVDEVELGSIRHALAMNVYNPMFGPECSAEERDSPAAGSTCGFFVSPAERVEFASGGTENCGPNTIEPTVENRERTIPHGMRFAVDMSDADIESWLDSRGYTGAFRRTAKIFATAMRDYGFVIAETTCWDAGIEVDGSENPQTRQRWEDLGVPVGEDAAQQLLWGLVTEDNLYVVKPTPIPGRDLRD